MKRTKTDTGEVISLSASELTPETEGLLRKSLSQTIANLDGIVDQTKNLILNGQLSENEDHIAVARQTSYFREVAVSEGGKLVELSSMLALAILRLARADVAKSGDGNVPISFST